MMVSRGATSDWPASTQQPSNLMMTMSNQVTQLSEAYGTTSTSKTRRAPSTWTKKAELNPHNQGSRYLEPSPGQTPVCLVHMTAAIICPGCPSQPPAAADADADAVLRHSTHVAKPCHHPPPAITSGPQPPPLLLRRSARVTTHHQPSPALAAPHSLTAAADAARCNSTMLPCHHPPPTTSHHLRPTTTAAAALRHSTYHDAVITHQPANTCPGCPSQPAAAAAIVPALRPATTAAAAAAVLRRSKHVVMSPPTTSRHLPWLPLIASCSSCVPAPPLGR
jgi:hypothetical protein